MRRNGGLMSDGIPLGEWIDEEEGSVRIVLCDMTPDAIVLIDTTSLSICRYVPDRDDDGLSKAKEELEKQLRAQTVGLRSEVDW